MIELFKKTVVFAAVVIGLPVLLISFCFFQAFGFLLLLGLILLLLKLYTGLRSHPLHRPIFAGVKFALSMLLTTVICTWVWETHVDGNIYLSTDDGFGYWGPGDWVHNHDGIQIEVVPKIVPHSMSEPDEIKAGWSVAGLWCVWWALFGTSLGFSIFFAWVCWGDLIRLAHRRVPDNCLGALTQKIRLKGKTGLLTLTGLLRHRRF